MILLASPGQEFADRKKKEEKINWEHLWSHKGCRKNPKDKRGIGYKETLKKAQDESRRRFHRRYVEIKEEIEDIQRIVKGTKGPLTSKGEVKRT